MTRRLFCFPHAGGQASSFAGWTGLAPDGLEIVPLEYRGRGVRYGESAYANYDQAVRELAHVISADQAGGMPYGLFGHSMGALLAFDVASALARRGEAAPRCVFVSGRNPPHRASDAEQGELDDGRLMHLLTEVGGVPDALVSNGRFLKHYLGRFRDDLVMLRSRSTIESGVRLDCRIVVMHGEDDTAVAAAWLPEWARYSRAGHDVLAFPGGHFFLHEHPHRVLPAVAEALT
ncbi:thioesterase II family protein [Burkholderia theae]|uniref:thioesterase II family protein n=1 Tax=Burkholderia theae TaxID=3143496 RepID=UPI003AFB2DE4